ncbi:hypothetical protein NW762_012018 [Fusarium torreyae]|uniref:FAD-binding domain-containing protein n=1 Tax=Fusarium torreyae TaxID=1237075 RepID=A0A9W8RQY8_9HYPO|nr:hypothetical protein NW762_012018 [Fusarium torreyae]
MKILNSAGVGDDLRSKGLLVDTVAWRRLDGSYIAGLDHVTQKNSPDRMIALPLNQVSQLLKDHAEALPSLSCLFNCKVINIGQDDSKAWIDALDVSTEKQVHLEADYIVGCDGANSIIRRSLFGDMEFPGRTWDEQIIATNVSLVDLYPVDVQVVISLHTKYSSKVHYDFEKFGYCDSNFIIDPANWYMAAKITKDGLWRVTYGETSGLTRDELIARQPEKFEKMLPGNPKPDQYKLVSISPYRVHQRLATKLRVGRFLLAADAAHLCNPFGGLGLTGGVVDVQGLYQCLLGIHLGKADPSILDVYSDVRRQKYLEIVDPISSSNLRRMFTGDPARVLETDEFLQMCKKAETDPELATRMLQADFEKSAHLLSYDFTQHYYS